MSPEERQCQHIARFFGFAVFKYEYFALENNCSLVASTIQCGEDNGENKFGKLPDSSLL